MLNFLLKSYLKSFYFKSLACYRYKIYGMQKKDFYDKIQTNMSFGAKISQAISDYLTEVIFS